MLEVVCAVLIRNQKVLVCERAPGRHLAGSWEFPGGKVESGENHAMALKREIAEELQCHIKIDETLASVQHDYPGVSIHLHAFACNLRPDSPEPDALEHTSIRWIAGEEMNDLPMADADLTLWLMIKTRGLRLCSLQS